MRLFLFSPPASRDNIRFPRRSSSSFQRALTVSGSAAAGLSRLASNSAARSARSGSGNARASRRKASQVVTTPPRATTAQALDLRTPLCGQVSRTPRSERRWCLGRPDTVRFPRVHDVLDQHRTRAFARDRDGAHETARSSPEKQGRLPAYRVETHGDLGAFSSERARTKGFHRVESNTSAMPIVSTIATMCTPPMSRR
jgi:hypothetical protein